MTQFNTNGESETKILFVNDESEDELTVEELAMSGAEFLAAHEHPTKVSESIEEVDEELSIKTVLFSDGTTTTAIIWK